MKALSFRMLKSFTSRFAVNLAILFVVSLPAALAAPITGVVTNLTSNKPSPGDTVALIRLQQGMQVAAQATTDPQGRYTLNMTDTDPMHLVRVTHQGANYFQPLPPGKNTVNIDVYDAAEKVDGITTEADVQRMETGSDGLHVTENYFVKNASSPPRTRIGMRSYVFYLPKDAEIISSAALGPGSMPVQSSPMPAGAPGEYAFVFPLRPGETRFQVTYRLPYSGSLQFHPQVAAPVDNFALILPKSIHFSDEPANTFQPLNDDLSVQTFLVKNLKPDAKVSFHISGRGQLPQETAANASQQSGAAAGPANPEAAAQAAAENNTRPGIGLGVPIDTPDPLHKYKWWIISVVVVLLAVGAGVSMRQTASTPENSNAPASNATYNVASGTRVVQEHSAVLLQSLKEELFALESERIQGLVSAEEYDRQKAALEIVLRRALERNPSKSVSTAV